LAICFFLLFKKIKILKEKEPKYHFAVDGHTFEVIRKEQPDLLNKVKLVEQNKL
jgi:hypothetical protein